MTFISSFFVLQKEYYKLIANIYKKGFGFAKQNIIDGSRANCCRYPIVGVAVIVLCAITAPIAFAAPILLDILILPVIAPVSVIILMAQLFNSLYNSIIIPIVRNIGQSFVGELLITKPINYLHEHGIVKDEWRKLAMKPERFFISLVHYFSVTALCALPFYYGIQHIKSPQLLDYFWHTILCGVIGMAMQFSPNSKLQKIVCDGHENIGAILGFVGGAIGGLTHSSLLHFIGSESNLGVRVILLSSAISLVLNKALLELIDYIVNYTASTQSRTATSADTISIAHSIS